MISSGKNMQSQIYHEIITSKHSLKEILQIHRLEFQKSESYERRKYRKYLVYFRILKIWQQNAMWNPSWDHRLKTIGKTSKTQIKIIDQLHCINNNVLCSKIVLSPCKIITCRKVYRNSLDFFLLLKKHCWGMIDVQLFI
jgi:hypothetical protein